MRPFTEFYVSPNRTIAHICDPKIIDHPYTIYTSIKRTMTQFFTRTRNLLATVVATVFLSSAVSGQIAMTRSVFNGAYAPIVGGTTSTATGDDAYQQNIPVGFSFSYLGTPYTQFSVSTNGWLSFVNGATFDAYSPDLYSTTTNGVVAPWWDDLSTSAIVYQTTGTVGSQVCTIQWTSLTYYFTSTRTINYQVKLYEGTNVIEFWYGAAPTGTINTSESASIGLKSTSGGTGQYLDAVTGSGFTGNSSLQSDRWPSYNFRFTPGVPTPLAGGTYNVGIGQTYRNMNEAAADVNHRGISGPITFNLVDAQYDATVANGGNFFPILIGPVAGSSPANVITFTKIGTAAIVAYGGASGANGAIANQTSITALASNVDPVIGLVGADYITLNNLDIRGNIGNLAVDHGIGLYNGSGTDGATNNIIQNVTVTMNRANTGSRGFVSNVITTPTSAAGANSNNTFRDFTITSVYAGIQLLGNATFPDLNTQVTRTNCATFNTIGNPATANDIGNGTAQTYGILATNQSGFTISNNSIRNVSGSAVQTDGIVINTFQGTCTVSNNKIQTIRNFSTTSTTGIAGIRMSHTTTGTHTIRVYNNSVSEITSAYTGVATAARTLKGIFVNGAGGSTAQMYEIYNNAVSIDGSGSLNLSSACMEVNNAGGPVYKLGNNIFANFTATQTGVARHYVFSTPTALTFGPAGTTSNNNDVFIANDAGVSGFTGFDGTTPYNTLANWSAAITPAGLETVSLAINPLYVNNLSDLHPGALALNAAGQAPPVYITADQECAPRTPDNDIGAYVIAACSGIPTAGTISGATSVCTGSGTTLTLTGASSGAGITYQWASATTNGGPYTTLLGTSTTQATGPLTVPTYYVVGVGCTVSGQAVQTTQFTVLINPLPAVAVTPTSGSVCLPGGSPIALTASNATTYTWLPAAGLSSTTIATPTANPAATTTYTVTGTDGNGCVNTATTTITVGENPSISTPTATPPVICNGGSSQLQVTGATTASYAVTSIPYAVTPTPGVGVTTLSNAGVAVTPLSAGTLDDGGWQNQTIPFSFMYFGTAYTSFAVSTNGFVWLGTGAPNTYTGYSNTFPSAFAGRPAIGPLYSDLDFRTVGTINYFISGTAPYRKLVINWSGGNFYNTVGSLNTQLVIYETSNVIEAHTTSSTGTNAAVQGIQNAAGTTAVVAPGRNNVTWAVGVPDAYRWAPSGGTLTYSWLPATFLSSTTINNPMANAVTATTTYTVSVANGACTASGTVTLTAGAVLSATASVTPVSPVCEGTNVTFNATAIGGGAPYSYTWAGPNSFTSTSQNPTITAVTTAASGTYTVTINDGCASMTTATVTLVVNGAPTISVSPVTATFCSPGPGVTLTASGTSASYAWAPGATLSAVTGTSVVASPTAVTTYTVTGTAANGCVASATTTITPATTPTVTVTSSASAVCINSSATLTASATAAGAYCQPVYSTGTVFGDYVSLVQLNTLNSPSVGAATPYYTLFPASGNTTTTLVAGSTYTITLTAGTYTQNDLAAWIDFSQNGVLNDVGEKLGETDNVGASPATTSFTFTVPLTAANGTTRLRVRDMDHGGTNDMDPCAAQSIYGETEDYIITITGGVDPITFAWSPATYLNATTGSTVISTPTALTPVTYSVIGTTAAGCSDTATTTITVNALPVVALSGSSSFCAGDSTLLTGTGGGTSQWYLNGVAIPGATASTYYAVQAGVYNMTKTNLNGCVDSSATGITVVVNALPTVTASATPSTVCSGAMVTANGGGATSYTWSGGISDNVPFPATATLTYTVTGTDANGCMDTASTTVTVNALPTVVANVTATVVCAGSSVTFTGSGASTYVWTGGVSDGIAFTPVSTNTYTVTGTDVNGCVNTDVATVTVNALPVVMAMSTDTVTCMNDIVTFMGMGASSYTWNNGVTDGVPYAVLASDSFIVTGTDVNGCMNMDTLLITVNPLPTVTASVTDTLVCAGDSVTFTGSGALSYTWNNGVMDGMSYSVMSSDTFIVTGADVNGCMNTASVMVNVNALPNVTVTLPLDTACLLLGPVTLGGETPVGGIWSGPGVTGNSFNPGAAGNGMHAIMYTYIDSVTGCSATAVDSMLVDICNDVDALNNATLQLYPNPNNGEFTLIPGGSGVVDVMIYSATGQLVQAEKANCGQINPIRIDASGMYSIVLVTADGQRTTQRVIVNR